GQHGSGSPRMPAKLVWPDQLSRKAQSCRNRSETFPIGKLLSKILVAQTAYNWHLYLATDSLHGTRVRRAPRKRKVRTRLVVIFVVGFEQVAEMPSAQHNDMVGQ